MGATQSKGRPTAPASTATPTTQPTSTQPSLPQPTAIDPKPTVTPSESPPKRYLEDAATGLIIQTSHFDGRVIRPKPHRQPKATHLPRPSPQQKYTAWSANAPPFQWFTQRGQRPLDEDEDVVWEEYKGRYYASRLSTLEHDPSIKPKLMTKSTAFWVIPNAKRDLTQAKRKRTGDPNTRWDTEVPAAKRAAVSTPQPPVAVTAVNRVDASVKGIPAAPKKRKTSHSKEIRRPNSPKKQRVVTGWTAIVPPPAPAPTIIIHDAVWTRRPDLDIATAGTSSWIDEAEQAGWFDGYVNVDIDGIDASIMDDYHWESGFKGI